MSAPEEELTLPQACVRVGRSWPATHRLAMQGAFGPVRQEPSGRWRIPSAGIAGYLAREERIASVLATP
jgi:hypothetical protein